MANRPSLADNMYKAANPDVELEEGADKPTPARKPSKDKAYLTPSRRGQKVISIYVDPEVFKQFKILALNLDLNGESLMYEALNDLFKKHGMPAIAFKTNRNGVLA